MMPDMCRHAENKKVLMVLTSTTAYPDGSPTGWYLPEAAHPHSEFEKAGYSLTYCSITGTAQVDPSSIDATKEDEICVKYLSSKPFGETQMKLEDAEATDYDVIFFVGGFGTMWDFPDSKAVQESIKKMWDSGKIVAAVCHGPCALYNVKLDDGSYLVAGKEMTGFTNGEEDAVQKYAMVSKPQGPGSNEDVLKERGAEYKDGGVFQVNICQSGNLFTGQNPPSAGPLAQAIVKALSS